MTVPLSPCPKSALGKWASLAWQIGLHPHLTLNDWTSEPRTPLLRISNLRIATYETQEQINSLKNKTQAFQSIYRLGL